MKVEVRCCCKPEKLLGTLELQTDRVRSVVLPLNDGKTLTLPVAIFSRGYGDSRSYRAVKAEGVDLETLMKCPSFEPAKDACE